MPFIETSFLNSTGIRILTFTGFPLCVAGVNLIFLEAIIAIESHLLLKIHIKLLTRITNKRIVNANIKALQQIYDES